MRQTTTGGSFPPARDTAGTINVWRNATGAYRVCGTFIGGGEAYARTMGAACHIALSMSRWWRRHQDEYLARLRCCEDAGDRLPEGWTPPRRRG